MRYARIPLFVALVALVGLIAWINRERELPWEEMPTFTARPTGRAVRLDLKLRPDQRIHAAIEIDLKRLRIRRHDPEEVDQAHQRATYVFDFVPVRPRGGRGGGHRLEMVDHEIGDGRWPDAFAGWEDLFDFVPTVFAEPRAVGNAVSRGAARIRSRRLRAGERFAAEFDSDRSSRLLPWVPNLGPGKGWVACTVDSVTRGYVTLHVDGGIRLESPPLRIWLEGERFRGVPLAAQALIRSLVKPLGKVGQVREVRARLKGLVKVNADRLLPARLTFELELELTGEAEDGRAYELDAELLVSTPRRQWLRAR